MSTTKNVNLRQFNGSDYDTIYPRTLGSNIINAVSNSNALGGYSYSQVIANAVAAGCKIATGSYTGTGTYGAANPCSLTFHFLQQKLV